MAVDSEIISPTVPVRGGQKAADGERQPLELVTETD